MRPPRFKLPRYIKIKPKHEDVPPDVSHLKAVEDEQYAKKIEDPDLAYTLFQGIPWIEATALLIQEMKEVPFSPVSMQIKALIRVEANRDAREIISKLDSEEL